MKRLGAIWGRVTAFENLYRAYRLARRGKANRPAVALFALDLEHELLTLQKELVAGVYRPGAYRLFTLYERKPRLIAAAPFRDRVVHHALMRQVEPLLDRTFIHDSYACRQGKGVHRAVNRYQVWARRYAYVLKMDVARYFPSIDHGLLLAKLRRCIKDRRVLSLFETIIQTAPTPLGDHYLFPEQGDDLLTVVEAPLGLPIGNLTSQFLANLYLDGFDHWMKETMRQRAYLRYVDDMAVLANDSGFLVELRAAVRERFARERLLLHPKKAEISRTVNGLDLLGYRVFPDFKLLRNDNGHRFARRLRGLANAYGRGVIGIEEVSPRVSSWVGHARQADTLGLRRAILGATVFGGGRA